MLQPVFSDLDVLNVFLCIPHSGLKSEKKVKFKEIVLFASNAKIYILLNIIDRFIWNAEISVSVAIHCYERLF